jgi:NTE family protein
VVKAENNGMLATIKQTAREYSSSIFPSNDDEEEAPGLFYAIANSINIFQDRITRSRLAGDPADILITPHLAHISLLDFHRAEEAIAEGEAVVERLLPEIERITAHF